MTSTQPLAGLLFEGYNVPETSLLRTTAETWRESAIDTRKYRVHNDLNRVDVLDMVFDQRSMAAQIPLPGVMIQPLIWREEASQVVPQLQTGNHLLFCRAALPEVAPTDGFEYSTVLAHSLAQVGHVWQQREYQPAQETWISLLVGEDIAAELLHRLAPHPGLELEMLPLQEHRTISPLDRQTSERYWGNVLTQAPQLSSSDTAAFLNIRLPGRSD